MFYLRRVSKAVSCSNCRVAFDRGVKKQMMECKEGGVEFGKVMGREVDGHRQ